MGAGIEANTAPNLPEITRQVQICNRTLKSVICSKKLNGLQSYEVCSVQAFEITFTKNRKEDHKPSCNLDHSSAANACKPQQPRILTGSKERKKKKSIAEFNMQTRYQQHVKKNKIIYWSLTPILKSHYQFQTCQTTECQLPKREDSRRGTQCKQQDT